jgi:uncharacterized protein (TIGR03437 family)
MIPMGLFSGERFATLLGLALSISTSAVAQGRLDLQQPRSQLRAGQPAELAASQETVDFLLSAKTRTVEVDGQPEGGLVVAPNRARDRILLAASARIKPGNHTVKISAVGDTGETRETTMDVVVGALQTVPSNSTRAPVVLLNGWEAGYTGLCNVASASLDTFGNLAQYLVADGAPVVYLFDNCAEDPNQPIEVLGNDLATFLHSIQFDNGSQVQQIDLVAHSMGGLIVRSYLAGLQPSSGVVLTPPSNTLVHKLVLIATPNFGSFIAGTYAVNLAASTQASELIPGSSFLWNLGTWNQFGDDMRGVNAIAVVGNAGIYNSTVANASDGLVTMTSASLGFVAQQTSATRIVPYCHVDPVVFSNLALGAFQCNAPGIADVTDTNQLTGQIVRSFLAGTSTWTTIGGAPTADPYLSKDGGVLFGLLNSNGSYVADLSQVQWGSVMLTNGGDANTIFYDDMVFGTAQFVATSSSLGTVSCASDANPVGYIAVTRCKFNATITSISPEAKLPGRVVSAGTALTLNGVSFGTKCASCKVTATPVSTSATAAQAQTLSVTSWSNSAIVVTLPASLTGLLTLTVMAATSNDSINVMVVSSAPAIAVSQSSLQFSYTPGGTVPPAQTISVTNSGSGSLLWTATSSAPWLTVTPTSDAAPSSISVSVSPAGMSPGSYQGTVQITSSGVSNSPVSIAITLTVASAGPTLAVAPQTLSFQYAIGAAAPPAQTVSITNAGSGTLTWTASDSDSWVVLTPLTGSAPATLTISVNPAGLAAGNYSSNVQVAAAGAAGTPATITVQLSVQASSGINIAGLVNAASSQPGFASATWVSIYGTSLAGTTYSWQSSDFVNGALPTSLDGVSVTINGNPAYISYISPTQINVLAPDDTTIGPVQVQVTSGGQQSNSFTAQKAQFAPAFFLIGNGPYVAAQHADSTLVGNVNLLPGVTTRPASPGEVVQIYATGFGPTNPSLPTSQQVTTPAMLANQVQVTIGGVAADVQYAGLVEAGLYQLNVTVPQLPNGDAALLATIGGVSTQPGVMITVQQ